MASQGNDEKSGNDADRAKRTVKKPGKPTNSRPAPKPSAQPPKVAAKKQPAGQSSAKKPAVASDATNPFGGRSDTDLTKRLAKKSDNVPLWIAVALAVFGTAAGVGYLLSRSTSSRPAQAIGTIYQNLGRKYIFTTPGPQWVQDDSRAVTDKVDLAFHRADLNAWLLIKSTPTTTPGSLGLLADQVLDDWRAAAVDLEEAPPTTEQLFGVQAVHLAATNKTDKIALDAYTFANQGILYRIEIQVPQKNYDTVQKDYAAALKGFDLLGERSPAVPEELGTMTTGKKTFRGQRANYTIAVPGRGWKENPELGQGGRFADLKLVGPRKDVTFVVSVRETTDLQGVEQLFLRREQKLSETYEVRPDRKELSIDGKAATGIEVIVKQVDGEYLLAATFLKSETMVFQLVGRTPVAVVAEYVPIFADIAMSFRLLDEKARPAREVAMSKQTPEPTDPKTEDVAPQDEEISASEKTKKSVAAATPTKEAKANVSLPKAGPAAEKRRSLDDLD